MPRIYLDQARFARAVYRKDKLQPGLHDYDHYSFYCGTIAFIFRISMTVSISS